MGDEVDIRVFLKIGCVFGIFGSWYGNFVCRNIVECNKCGCKSSLIDGIV